jgi:hypothetical protein
MNHRAGGAVGVLMVETARLPKIMPAEIPVSAHRPGKLVANAEPASLIFDDDLLVVSGQAWRNTVNGIARAQSSAM